MKKGNHQTKLIVLSLLIGVLLIGSIVSAADNRTGCDCSNSVYSTTSYLAHEQCYLLEVGFPVLFNLVPGNRQCCRAGFIGDPFATGCYEWHEKACQTNLPSE